MKYLILTLGILCSDYHAFSQTPSVCEALLSKEIVLLKNDRDFIDYIQEAFREMIGCEVDSLDYTLLFRRSMIKLNLLAPAGIQVQGDTIRMSYRQVLSMFEERLSSPEYQQYKINYKAMVKASKMPASLSTWEKDKTLFEELGWPESVMNKVHELLSKDPDPGMSYFEFIRLHGREIELSSKEN